MMQCFPAGAAWYVLSAEPGADRVFPTRQGEWRARLVDDVLDLGFDVYQPRERRIKMRRRQHVEVVEPLFSGYLFVRFDEWRDDWQRLFDVKGVEDVLSNCDRPSRIPTPWIEALRRAETAGAFDRTPDSTFKVGDVVRIADGPFAGLTARIEQLVFKLKSARASKRVKVLMEFLGAQTMFELPVASLEKA